jgi:hypothetical protein
MAGEGATSMPRRSGTRHFVLIPDGGGIVKNEKKMKPPVLEFWLTGEQWIQFTRVMEHCQRLAGGPVGPAVCLEVVCRSFLDRKQETGMPRR